MTRDFLIGAGLISAGIAAMTVIITPMGVPFLSSSYGETTKRVKEGNIVETRWASMEPPALKGDLKVTLLEPSMLDPAPLGPRDGDPIEQATERKIFDQGVEANVKEYHRQAEREREYCSRHGLVRYYFYRHHHQMWRCRRGR